MLIVKKLEYDSLGNINMALKHYEYTIRILTCIEPSNKLQVLQILGEFYQTVNRHRDYKRVKAFTSRVYNLKRWGYANYNYFIRYKHISEETILGVLEGNPQQYNVNVTVVKYSVGLANVCSSETDGEMYFDKVYTTDKKADLIRLINAVIKRTFENARNYEPYILGDGGLRLHTRR